MPYSLAGRNVLITGGSRYEIVETIPAFGPRELIIFDRGLGALVAQKFAAQGSNIAINYMSNKAAADKVASEIASEYNVKTIVIQGVRLHRLKLATNG